jgi:3-oxoadipate CoA-transferase beta subunit
VSGENTWVIMTLFDRDRAAKLVRTCSYPLTGLACVTRIYTDHAVFLLESDGRPGTRDVRVHCRRAATRTGLPLQEPHPPV